jgi:N12 class adenine-specific DNA methylase
LRLLEAEKRSATSEEKTKLVRYVGWGGLPQIFSPATDWQAENVELASLLSEEEFRLARASTLNAHYTSGEVIGAMYGALERLGFREGRILEPACGIGHFIGYMPESIQSRSIITGVEIDPVTARIAKALYPDADIRNEAFEKATIADEFYDVAISNIPFGDYKPYDPKFNQHGFLIHDYFFAAGLEKVRPGGILMFVTSMGTMDKNSPTLRKYLGERADLIGAIRLPNNAFKQNANTEVTTDIIILKKRRLRETAKSAKWEKVVPYTSTKGEVIPINEYYFNQPHMMLGEMELKGRMYSRNEPTLISNGKEIKDALAEAVKQLPQNLYESLNRPLEITGKEQSIPAPGHVKPNAYTLHDDEIAVRRHEKLIPLPHLPIQTKLRVRGMIRVRDAVRECLRTQLEDAPDEDIQLARALLNQAYDRFVSRFGPLCDRVNANAFEGDPDLPLLFSLENYDSEKKKAAKTAIFRERTIQKQKPVTSVNSAKEALLVSLNENGRVDLKHMATLLTRPTEDFLPELRSVLFLNPQTQAWETEDQYLSGDVREKLKIAEAASLTEPHFAENLQALKSVQPEDLSATEIDARLGACWIPVKDFETFAQELLGTEDIRVYFTPQLGTWTIQPGYAAKESVANTTEWGTNRATALELMEDALNVRTPTIYDKIRENNKDKLVVNANATEAAREKQQKIKDRFREWVWQNDERRERLVKKYNEEFNAVRLRVFNGEHLTLPGASQNIKLQRQQKNGVWRILQTPNTLLGHVVGAGKTFTMVASAMELKRLGLARKPIIVVPNHMLGQFSSEFLMLYPGANILAASKDDFEKHKRRELMSRIATGNWDAVIVTHSGFEKIPMSEKTTKAFFEVQLDELENAIREQKKESNTRRIVKQLESAKKKLETRLKLMAAEEKKDNTLTFEELGIDRLFVDEAHYFKNLFYISKMTRIAGLPQTASERAFDMFLKTQYIQQINNGGGVVFATGTPIANSVAEMFTMQRYLQMGTLRKQKLHHFDGWAATFGEPVTAMELAPDGAGYRLNTRFARFINVPELMQIFCQVADIQTAAQLKLPVPEIKTGKPIVIRAPSTPELKKVVDELVRRADAIRNRLVSPEKDNMLKITTEGRKAALDLRVLNPQTPDHPDSKVNHAADRIFEIWKETATQRCTQLVFCDLSTPSKMHRQFCVYDDLKAKLMKHGVPADEIAFMQDYDSDVQKHILFKEVNAGKIRVLIGSTQKMGAGTNVQERLVAEHHLDPPWRPADVEQRDGRILRQGNKNAVIQIYRYVTEGSFDAYMWQTLETKAKFIHQVMTGDTHIRHIEDIDSRALTYAEVKAIASGNPLVIEKASVDAEITRLTRLRSQHAETQYRIRDAIRRLKEDMPVFSKRIENLKLDMKQRIETRGETFQILLEKTVFKDRGLAGEMLNRIAQRVSGATQEYAVGTFAGFQLFVRPAFLQQVEIILKGHNQYTANVSDSPLGTIRSLEYVPQNFEERLASHQRDLADAEKKGRELETKIGQPFEHEAKLQSLGQRQKELEDALDITKNQASSSLAAEETEVQVEKETEVEVVENPVEQTSAKISVVKAASKTRVAMTH